MIRKEGKARWVYECQPCNIRTTHPDHFRAIERQQQHEKTFDHFGAVVGTTIRESFAPLLATFGRFKLQPWQEDVLKRSTWEGMR